MGTKAYGNIRGYGGPLRYVQGPGALASLGIYAADLSDRALILMDGFVQDTYGETLMASLAEAGVTATAARFGGESTDAEVDRCISLARDAEAGVVIGVGGGKTLDTGKLTARAVDARIMTVPTIASTDSPTSAIGVIYTEDGVYVRVEQCNRNPDVVLVDSEVILNAPVRFLSSGMGDALSTWYEARSNFESQSKNYIDSGFAPTIAGAQIAKACHDTLMRDGISGYHAAKSGCLTQAVENIIEANTLLSGLGFENCGVSAAHGIHDALTVLEPTHDFMHGEKVAFGIICLLVIENRPITEITEAAQFCAAIGLPITLASLGLADATDQDLLQVGEAAMAPASVIHSVPVPLSAKKIAHAIRAADAIAKHVT
ncbi:glycerol dehydrogenase [Halomonas sp. EGI 63088]|uniref:Glycerol dehydrogenase n=1 Tax=Halomonas flagellata TaxID=2920385 RepID=A0ABS9RWZ0_9GAMM|nr:glycerol dehydrogenase [Halomonas flagellata]MCH4564340.1 glycerol dehydrogenase [Halomonas flagellata]